MKYYFHKDVQRFHGAVAVFERRVRVCTQSCLRVCVMLFGQKLYLSVHNE